MRRRKVLNISNVRLKIPVTTTAVCYLMLEKFSAPGWLYGVFGVLFLLVWIITIYDIIKREELPPLEDVTLRGRKGGDLN